MTEQTKPQFADILNLLKTLPPVPDHTIMPEVQDTGFSTLKSWVAATSRLYDFSGGFHVNRCALYWAGYDHSDGFDGQKFVDSCQDSRGSLRSLAQILDTDLQIFELDPHNQAEIDGQSLAIAASYGMMAIEESTQLFCATSFGRGVETAAEKAVNALKATDHFDLEHFMISHCGLDHAALLGNAIAAILKGIPCLIEGNQGRLIAALITRCTGHDYPNLLLTANMPDLCDNPLPGHIMITTAIFLKTLYTGSEKSSCGKVRLNTAA